MQTTLAILVCIGAGTVGGIFFAFSTFVMRALAQLPANQGIAAMQRINVVVLNPMFLGVFMGTAVLSVAAPISAFMSWEAPRSLLLAAAGVSYFAGTWLVTIVFNVPRNQRLARMEAESSEARTYWPVYVREWTFWNHVRTLAAIAAAACAAGALASGIR